MTWVFALTVATLFAVGVFHILQRDAIKFVLGFSLLIGGANLFVLACATFTGSDAPYGDGMMPTDPVPQVLILTAIAIGFGVTAFLIALVLSISRTLHTVDVDRVSELEG